MKKIIFVTFLLFISFVSIPANAALPPLFVVNDNLKTCTYYNSSATTELSNNWKYVERQQGLSYEMICESLGYKMNTRVGDASILKPYYFFWFWGLIVFESIIFIGIVYLIFKKYTFKKIGVLKYFFTFCLLLFLVALLLIIFYSSWEAITPHQPAGYY